MLPVLTLAAVLWLSAADSPDPVGVTPVEPPGKSCLKAVKADECVLEQWTTEDSAGELIRIKKDGKLIKEYSDPDFYHMTIYTKEWLDTERSWGGLTPDPDVPFDFDGDGHDVVVIGYWSGGAHCCFGAYVFSTFGTPKDLGKVDFRDGDLNRIRDLDKDGRPEFEMYDWTFEYWHASFAGSPAPRVIVGFQNGAFVSIPALMKQASPTEKEWKSMLAREGSGAPVPWASMLKLIYTGHGDLAWKLFDAIWPDGRDAPEDLADWKSKAAFRSDFEKQMKQSPYWNAVKAMNAW